MTILQIVATRIATVAKNRDCVNRPLPQFATVALRFCHGSSRLIESEPKVHKVSLYGVPVRALGNPCARESVRLSTVLQMGILETCLPKAINFYMRHD